MKKRHSNKPLEYAIPRILQEKCPKSLRDGLFLRVYNWMCPKLSHSQKRVSDGGKEERSVATRDSQTMSVLRVCLTYKRQNTGIQIHKHMDRHV